MKIEIAQSDRTPVFPKEGFQKEMTPMNQQQIRMIALQATGEYLMKHIAGIMGIVEDKRSRNKEGVLNEGTLVEIEAQVKAIAKELVQQSREV